MLKYPLSIYDFRPHGNIDDLSRNVLQLHAFQSSNVQISGTRVADTRAMLMPVDRIGIIIGYSRSAKAHASRHFSRLPPPPPPTLYIQINTVTYVLVGMESNFMNIVSDTCCISYSDYIQNSLEVSILCAIPFANLQASALPSTPLIKLSICSCGIDTDSSFIAERRA